MVFTGVILAEESKKEEQGDEPKEKTRDKLISGLLEGKRMEAYAEHHTNKMHYCFFCEKITYKKIPGKEVGKKWICVNCLHKLKEILEGLERWEEEMAMGSKMQDQLDENLGI